ncbi:MAG: amino acid--[acyl-carrier-protein] ligase [Proteobacteria bacterium]|nr:amino acid--[acyl-carrier-protein] ligase [Pseudomonadota bacterium]
MTQSSRDEFVAMLASAGILIPSTVAGLYGRGVLMERVAEFVSHWVNEAGVSDGAEFLRFPPLMPRRSFEDSGYFRNFPNLVGTVHCFCGDEEDHRLLMRTHDAGGDWTSQQSASDLVMVPAACYPVYPAVAARGPVAAAGRIFDVCSYCFRREPSQDPNRQQMFRQHERVYIGNPEGARAFRATWVDRAKELASLLGLPFQVVPANDPFFGRTGRIMIRGQIEQALKLELVTPSVAESGETACVSFNLHLDKMAQAFGLELEDRTQPHTACVGFGLERLALAVFWHHGTDVGGWPRALVDALVSHGGRLP